MLGWKRPISSAIHIIHIMATSFFLVNPVQLDIYTYHNNDRRITSHVAGHHRIYYNMYAERMYRLRTTSIGGIIDPACAAFFSDYYGGTYVECPKITQVGIF